MTWVTDPDGIRLFMRCSEDCACRLTARAREQVAQGARIDGHNHAGTPVTVVNCESCGRVTSICPPVSPERWGGECLLSDCESYDVTRDADIWFDAAMEHGLVRRD